MTLFDNRIGKNFVGIVKATLSNFFVFGINIITAFAMPLLIDSTQQYGYWQLFSMYCSYLGFFMLGFNDGVHLNCIGLDYDGKDLYALRTYRNVVLLLGLFFTIVLLLIWCFFANSDKNIVYIFTIFNILPNSLNGYFLYINQNTLQLKKYTIATIIEKIFFVAMFPVLIIFGLYENYVSYLFCATLAKYFVVLYNAFNSKEIMFGKSLSFRILKNKILKNFTDGFMLMLTLIINSTIIVASKIFVEQHYGISDFGKYSFALNTLSFATIGVVAISQILYPMLKKEKKEKYITTIKTFDGSISIFSYLLLISYYIIYLIIYFIYKNYIECLNYLFILYPIFIYQCKSNILLMNTYKVKKFYKDMFYFNIIGVLMMIALVYLFHKINSSITYVALASIFSYACWYYISTFALCKKMRWKVSIKQLFDVPVITFFILLNYLTNFKGQLLDGFILSFSIFSLFILVFFYCFRKKVIELIKKLVVFIG